jgi:hypothetical protein
MPEPDFIILDSAVINLGSCLAPIGRVAAEKPQAFKQTQNC